MRVSIILGHPNPASFNHAIAVTAAETLRGLGIQVLFHDLHAEGFDPVLPAREISRDAPLPPLVAQHCEEIAAADGLIVVHPNWWGMPPAMLKGWVDRVLRPGVAYEFLPGDSGEGVPRGLLKIGRAIVCNTANTPEAREKSVFGDPLEAIWRHCVLGLCGVREVHRRCFGVIVTSTLEQRKAWLDEVRGLVGRVYGGRGRGGPLTPQARRRP